MGFYECFLLCSFFFIAVPVSVFMVVYLIAEAAGLIRRKYIGKKHVSKAEEELPFGAPIPVGDFLLLNVVSDLTVVSILTPERFVLACGHWYDDEIQDFVEDECLQFICYGRERVEIIVGVRIPALRRKRHEANAGA